MRTRFDRSGTRIHEMMLLCLALCLAATMLVGCDDDEEEAEDLDFDSWDVEADCDDTNAAVHPGATEICDGIDNDCDGEIDESDSSDASLWYPDEDGDGYGDMWSPTRACEAPSGMISDHRDCDDRDDEVNPDATEVCDGIDNDCDSFADVDDAVDAEIYYADADEDGFGDPLRWRMACQMPEGYVEDNSDCDDMHASATPRGTEVCDNVDNDCDGTVDEDDATDASTWYADADADGFGDADLIAVACRPPEGYVGPSTDCDDSRAEANPDAPEICDEIDNDCDGEIDEDAVDAPTWYADTDGDEFGDAAVSSSGCVAPEHYVADGTDCDDSFGTVNPGATEICDDMDNDCDDEIDEDDAEDAPDWFFDGDGDGFGIADDVIVACTAPEDYVHSGADCDDEDEEINPDADELWYDDIDADCDGENDPDPCEDTPPAHTIDEVEECAEQPNFELVTYGPCQDECDADARVLFQVGNSGTEDADEDVLVVLNGRTAAGVLFELARMTIAGPIEAGVLTAGHVFEIPVEDLRPCNSLVLTVNADEGSSECHWDDNEATASLHDICWTEPGG